MRYAVSVSSMLFLSLLGGVAQARGPAGGARGERVTSDRPARERPAVERSAVKPEWMRVRAERVGAPSGQRAERPTVAREITRESAGSFAPPRAAGVFTRTARITVDTPANKATVHSGGVQSGGTQSGGTQSGGTQSGGVHQGGLRQGGVAPGDHLRQVVRDKQRCPAGDVLCGAHRDAADAADPRGSAVGSGAKVAVLDLAKEAPADGGLLRLAAPFHKVRETFQTGAVRKLLCSKADSGFCSR